MTRIPLDEKCGMCNSYSWCGNQCKKAPVDVLLEAVAASHSAKEKIYKTQKFNREEYHRNYMRERMRKLRAKEKK
jgi:hypothetical protein